MLAKRCDEWERYPTKGPSKVLKTSAIAVQLETKTETSGHEARSIREVGTQVNMGYNVLEIESAIESNSFEHFATTLDREWPEEVFKATTVMVGNLAKIKRKTDVALVVDPDDQEEKGILNGMVERYPEISDLMNERLEERKVEYLCTATKVITSRRNAEEENSRYIYLVPHRVDGKGVNDIQSLHTTILDLKRWLLIHERKTVAIMSPEGLNKEYTRKVLERVFRESKVKIEYWIPGVPRQGKQGNGSRQMTRQKSRLQEETVLVKGQGKLYAELLKSVKKGVNIDEIGVKIRNIRKSATGNLMLTVEGGK